MGHFILYTTSSAMILLLFVLTTRAEPDRCCWYPQWEGMYDVKQGLYDKNNNYATMADIYETTHQDSNKKMIVSEMASVNASITIVETDILDYNKHIEYTITGTNCENSTLIGRFPENCIPEDAVYLGSRVIVGVTADMWLVSFYNGTFNVSTYRLTVSRQNCLPLQMVSVYFGKYAFVAIGTAENITSGIVDPSVFNIPPFCSQPAELTPQVSPNKPFYRSSKIFPHL